ncbi:MAG: GNAT family N-acetyltransferase [Solirubrobacterales bacterium]|nr:GNAT family N-acetyltransferase [Solirubrobacterales bacterium]
MTNTNFTYKTDLDGVDWQEIKEKVAADDFDNGRTPAQLERSFRNSGATVIAYAGHQIIGKARALTDGVCNAYIVDVWTYTPYRERGVAKTMLQVLLDQLPGQHVYLFTDTAQGFYEKLGFAPQEIGMGRVVGEWLNNEN